MVVLCENCYDSGVNRHTAAFCGCAAGLETEQKDIERQLHKLSDKRIELEERLVVVIKARD